MRLTDDEIRRAYDIIAQHHSEYLEEYGVKLPGLEGREGFTKNALVLVYLAQGYPDTQAVTKAELTRFVREYYPDTNDVQQGRHLARNGFYIAAGTRANRGIDLESGEYKLVTLEQPYPGFAPHQVSEDADWDTIKDAYDHRCATCGSKEGEPSFHYPNTITRLQRGHKDPNKPLEPRNIIPQCEKCNRPDRNNWVYDENGRVIRVANGRVIERSDRSVKLDAYAVLYEEFEGRHPDEVGAAS